MLSVKQLLDQKPKAIYSVSPADPVSYGVAVVLLSAAALAATLLPARRAVRVDPVRALSGLG